MKQKNKRKPKLKVILTSIISLLLVVGITVPIIYFSIPKEPVIHDLTNPSSGAQNVVSGGVTDSCAKATLYPMKYQKPFR